MKAGSAAAIFAFTLSLYGLTFSLEGPDSPDELERIAMAAALADGEGLRAAVQHSGRYPWLQSVLAWPLLEAADAVSSAADREQGRRVASILFTLTVSSIVPVLLYLLALEIGLSPRTAIRGALLWAGTSLLWPYSKRFFGEPLSALLLTGLAFALARYERSRSPGALASIVVLYALASAQLYSVLAFWPALVAALAFPRRPSPAPCRGVLLALAAAAGLAFLAVAWCNQIRHGDVLSFGYEGSHGIPSVLSTSGPGFSTPVLVGLYGLLLSPGRGLLFFAPLAVAGLFGWRDLGERAPRVTCFCAIASASLLLIDAKWWAWYGGTAYGPRLMIPVLPLLFLPAMSVLDRSRSLAPSRRSLLRLAAAWGVLVAGGGSLYTLGYDTRYWLGDQLAQKEHLEWWDPAYSVLARQWAHVVEHPEDVDTIWLVKDHPAVATVRLDPARPLKALRIRQDGRGPYPWIVAEMSLTDTSGRDLLHTPRLAEASATHDAEALRLAFDGNEDTGFGSRGWRDPRATITLTLDAPRTGVLALELRRARRWESGPVRLMVEQTPDGERWEVVDRERIAGDQRILSLRRSVWLLMAWIALLTGLLLKRARARAEAAQ